MFDKGTYNSELIESKKELDKLREQYHNELFNVASDDMNAYSKVERKYGKKIENAERKFAYEHDKYCDKYGLNNLKITENWQKFWSK